MRCYQIVGAAVLASGMALPAFAQDRNVTIVLPQTVDIVDPCMAARQTTGRVISENVNEMMIEFDYINGGLKPRLATDWRQIDDDTWQFKLREGVKWHDGSEFTARDVASTLARNKNPSLTCEVGGKFGAMEFAVETPDDHTINITTNPPTPILPLLMSVMPITSAAATPEDELTRKPVGTGPYVFETWNVGQSIILKRNPDYWGEQPEVEQATYVWRDDSAVAAAMVEIGEADIVPSLAMQDSNNPDTDFAYPNAETTYMRIDTRTAPLDDIRIREALNLAIDKEAFIGTLLPAEAQMASQLVVPTTIGYNKDMEPWPFDPQRATELVEAAKADGVPVDTEILIVARSGVFPNVTETMEAMMAMWKDVGLNVRLQMSEVSVHNTYYVRPFNQDGVPTLLGAMHDNATGDPVFSAYIKYASGGIQSVLDDPELDQMIADATTATGDDRPARWAEVFRVAERDIIASVPMFHMVGFTRVSPRLDYKPTIAANSELQLAQIRFR